MFTLSRNSLQSLFYSATFAALALTAPIGISDAAGLLTPSDGSRPALQIRDHLVTVVVEDGYAITRIEQVFENPHKSDFEAVYSFPVPDKAAVSEFTYWIDGKPVSGEVLAKQKAREIYEKEKAAGRETAITEQDSYKTFDVSVWPVRGGADVRVRLTYIQPAHVDTSIGRYVYPLEEGGVDAQKASFWSMSDQVNGRFSFDLELRSAYPIQSVRLPAHSGAIVKRDAEGDWHVHLGNNPPLKAGQQVSSDTPQVLTSTRPVTENLTHKTGLLVVPGTVQPAPFRLDTDVVVYWKLQDGLPAGLDVVTHKEPGQDRGTFMVVMTPGDDLKPITQGRDWVFVLDKSGSMRGKFATLANGVAQGLKKLTPQDRFRIVYFNQSADSDGGFVHATPENIRHAVQNLSSITPDGSTNLYAGLAHGLNNLDSDRSAGIVLVTDGVANVGETHKRAFVKLVDKQDVRLFTLVMGNSANRPLLKALTYASGGAAISVSNSDDVVGAVLSATSKLTHAAMHDVKVDVTGVRTADIAPARVGSLYRGQQLVLFGHYWGSGNAKLTLKAKVSGKPVVFSTNVQFPDVQTRNPEAERLWAFAAIEDMMQEMDLFGEKDDVKKAIVDLAVENSLVTPFTSMVVVKEKMFAQYGIERHYRDRLAKETAAQTQRAAQPARQQPLARVANQSNRATYSKGVHDGRGGSGAVDPFVFALMLLGGVPFAAGWIRQRRDPT